MSYWFSPKNNAFILKPLKKHTGTQERYRMI